MVKALLKGTALMRIEPVYCRLKDAEAVVSEGVCASFTHFSQGRDQHQL